MVCGHPFTQKLWVDIGYCFFCGVGWGKMGILAARGGGGRLWGGPALCMSWLQHPWGDTIFLGAKLKKKHGDFLAGGNRDVWHSCLRASAESRSSECLQELTEEKEAGNHKPLIDSLSFLQPIPSTNHIWKYSFQASFTMAKKRKNPKP